MSLVSGSAFGLLRRLGRGVLDAGIHVDGLLAVCAYAASQPQIRFGEPAKIIFGSVFDTDQLIVRRAMRSKQFVEL